MDAYSDYILRMANARASELRREAAEYAMSRAARANRVSRWRQARERFARRPRPAVEPVTPLPLPAPEPETELTRTA
ncbi:MAG: hypothetical protein M3326_03830 [Actinomycetota bacterium]|nr:hypothetical protein [Actinomycetota bacterium]